MSDERKAPLDLVPLKTLVGASRVLQHGNSRPKPGTTEPRAPGDFIERKLGGNFFASLLRHVMDMQPLNGVVTPETLAKLDRDSKLPVIDHVICNAIIIRAMLIRDGLLPVDPVRGCDAEDGWLNILTGMGPIDREAAERFFRDAETPQDKQGA
jgi:hypothetical protein